MANFHSNHTLKLNTKEVRFLKKLLESMNQKELEDKGFDYREAEPYFELLREIPNLPKSSNEEAYDDDE